MFPWLALGQVPTYRQLRNARQVIEENLNYLRSFLILNKLRYNAWHPYYALCIIRRKAPSDNDCGGARLVTWGLNEFSCKCDLRFNTSSWIKKSMLLFSPKRNLRLSSFDCKPSFVSKISLYHFLCPKAREAGAIFERTSLIHCR